MLVCACNVKSLLKSELDAVGLDRRASDDMRSVSTPVKIHMSFTRERLVSESDVRSLKPCESSADKSPSIWCRESVAKVSSWNPMVESRLKEW
jgi:hypothetical protein